MKKHFLNIIVLIIILVSSHLNAQNIIGKDNKNPLPVIKESMENLSFYQEFSFLNIERVNTEKGLFFKFFMGEEFGTSQKVGLPEFPIYSQFIEIPYGSDVEIEYSDIITETYSLNKYGNYKIIPVQKSISKSDTNHPFVINEKVYSTDGYFGNDLVAVEKLGFMGGVRLARLSISPIKYNPVSNTIIFVKSFNVNIKFLNSDIKSTIEAKEKYNNQQSAFIGSKLINEKNLSASVSSSPINRPLKMIILSDPMFTETLQPFIRWKKEKGIDVIELYKGQLNVGTTKEEMKNYLKSLWDNATVESPAADYLLICGDVQQIPAFAAVTDQNNPAPTDLYYAEYTGDFLPDVFYGRFSAQNVAQMESIINKTITYEQNLMQDTTYLKKTLLIAGRETNAPAPTCGNGQINYGKTYLQNNPSIDTLVYYNPASGNYSTQIRDSISRNGYSFINYTAHCDETGWSSPYLTANNINNMSNIGKFPFYINNCCLSSKFDENECFAEAIIRASNKGGVGAIGGSNYTYWYEDFYWSVGSKPINVNPNYDSNNLGAYDRLFHKNNEPYNKWCTTFGQIVQAGNLAVQQFGSNLANYYWEIYHLMGDPSLTPFIGLPKTMISSIPDSIALGSSNVNIQTEPYAFVGISQNGVLLGASQADTNGNVNIIFNSLINQVNSLKVVITNQFSKPIIDSIGIFVPNYPLLNINSVKYYDYQLQEVTELKNNEEYFISIGISNLGTVSIDSVKLNINNTSNLLFIDSFEYIGRVNGLSSVVSQYAMKVKILNGIKNKSQLTYNINVLGENNYYGNKTCSFETYCPELEIENLVISKDTVNNLFVGEEITVSFNIKNAGRNSTEVGYIYMSDISSNLSFYSDSSSSLTSLLPNESVAFSFKLILTSVDIENNFIKFKIGAVTSPYYNTRVYNSIALSGEMENFETGDITLFPWQNDASKPWTIESNINNIYQGSYSLRSGAISDNQKSILNIEINSIMKDSISFYIKTSTENDYDFARFYIDDILMVEKSGQNNWTRYSFPVNVGEHNYKWEYQKDYSGAYGNDAVWIDNIKFPANVSISSINNIEDEVDDIIIYPNPAKEFITITNLKSRADIKIFDALGKIMFYSSKSLSSNINISNLPNGVYYLSIKLDNNIYTKKFIIAR